MVKTRFLWGKEKSNTRDQEDSGTEGRGESHTPRPVHPSPTALGCFYQFRDTGMASQNGSSCKAKQRRAPQWSLEVSHPRVHSWPTVLANSSSEDLTPAVGPSWPLHPVRLNKACVRRHEAHLCSRQIPQSPVSSPRVGGREQRSRNKGQNTQAEKSFHWCGAATQTLSSLATEDLSACYCQDNALTVIKTTPW